MHYQHLDYNFNVSTWEHNMDHMLPIKQPDWTDSFAHVTKVTIIIRNFASLLHRNAQNTVQGSNDGDRKHAS